MAEPSADALVDLETRLFERMEKMIKQMVETCVNERLDNDHKRMRRQATAIARRPALCNFGQENYEYLLIPYLSNLVKNSNDLYYIIQRVIVDLFFNPDQKRNHTIYIPQDSYKCIYIHKDGNWRTYQLEPTLERAVRRANDVLQHYIVGSDSEDEKTFLQEIGKKKFEALKEFTEKIDNMEEFPEFRTRLLHEAEHTVITYQHIVHTRMHELPSSK